jgi:serine/threonine protein kinase
VAGTSEDGLPATCSPEVNISGPSASPELRALRLHLAQEFRTLAGLRHPHIVSVLDYGFDPGKQPYFTMEFLQNARTLDEAAGRHPFEVRVGLLLQILQALTYLHQRGVLHRDLKPGNILVVEGPRGPHVKLLDFGLARIARSPRSEHAEVAGTLGYIAPEVLGGAHASEQSDLFAVGVMAHEILVGAHPLGALPTQELVRTFLEPRPIFSDDERLGTALNAVLRRALCREPSERYPDAASFAQALLRATGLPLPEETFDIRESFLQAASFQSRDAEMEVLLTALRSAMSGRGQVLLVGGESGVGKSRLLDELWA